MPTQLEQLEYELQLYHDSLDQCLVVNPEELEHEIEMARREWNGLLSMYGKSHRKEVFGSLREYIQTIKEEEFEFNISWRANY